MAELQPVPLAFAGRADLIGDLARAPAAPAVGAAPEKTRTPHRTPLPPAVRTGSGGDRRHPARAATGDTRHQVGNRNGGAEPLQGIYKRNPEVVAEVRAHGRGAGLFPQVHAQDFLEKILFAERGLR